MSLLDLVKRVEKLAIDNSPIILTAIGVSGTITTAIFSGRASFKAAQIIANEEHFARMQTGDPDYESNTRRKFDLTWKLYIPAIGTGVLTVACIIAANRIGTRRAAAMAAAYSLSEKAFVEYKTKVIEKIGEHREHQARAEIAQDHINQNPVSSREVIITGNGDVLCYDTISGRYFKSNVETLRRAENDVTAQIYNDQYASLHEFYTLIGLPGTKYSNEVGWNPENRLYLDFSTVLSEDGQPCLSLEYRAYPIRNYYKLQ
jgi:hypothetical protein